MAEAIIYAGFVVAVACAEVLYSHIPWVTGRYHRRLVNARLLNLSWHMKRLARANYEAAEKLRRWRMAQLDEDGRLREHEPVEAP